MLEGWFYRTKCVFPLCSKYWLVAMEIGICQSRPLWYHILTVSHLVAMETGKPTFWIYLCIINLHLHRYIIILNSIEILLTIFSLRDKMCFFHLVQNIGLVAMETGISQSRPLKNMFWLLVLNPKGLLYQLKSEFLICIIAVHLWNNGVYVKIAICQD